jgi:asparagine synthase (glutamine-hydrolysing)
MCGFLLIHDDAGIRRDDALRALRTLARRGPDDWGHAVFRNGRPSGSDEAGDLFIGHRRLSIIGLTRENRQPFAFGEGHLAFNGEIYNYLELRDALSADGVEFLLKNSDTEVLAAGLATFGEAFLSRLNGMFAGVFYDAARGRILMFRDPAGQKPFYVYRSRGLLIAASEIKAIEAYVPLEVAWEKVCAGLILGYHNRGSVFQDVADLPPGHLLTIPYPSVPPDPPRARPIPSLPQTVFPPTEEGFADCYSRAVARHMRADVPVGLYLSGGIDSTITLHFLRQAGIFPTCFSIGFREPEFDETKWARMAAKHYDAALTVHYLDLPTFQEADAILSYFDEPFYDSSAIPTAQLNRLAAASVKVVLGGDGGDELFFGYKRYVFTRHAHRVARLFPRSWESPLLAVSGAIGGPRARRNKYVRNAFRDPADALFLNSHGVSMGAYISSPHVAAEAIRAASSSYTEPFAPGTDPAAWFLGEVPNYLSCDILAKSDRCSMMHGLEQRAPLLDAEVIAFALGLPRRQKVRFSQGKWIIKRIVARELGQAFAFRSKRGFRFPMRGFLTACQREVRDTIADGLRMGPFQAGPVLDRPFDEAPESDLEDIWKLFVLGRFLCNR